MKLCQLHESKVNDVMCEGFGKYLGAGLLSAAALMSQGHAADKTPPNPFEAGGGGAGLTPFDLPTGPQLDYFKLENMVSNKKGKFHKFNIPPDVWKAIGTKIGKIKENQNLEKSVYYDKIYEEYFSKWLPEETKKLGLSTDVTHMLIVHTLGVNAVKDLKQKYGEKWKSAVPAETVEFINAYNK